MKKIVNLKNVKVNDWLWYFRTGWVNVIKIQEYHHNYPIVIIDSNRDTRTFTLDGKEYITDDYPSIFQDAPVLYAEPRFALTNSSSSLLK